MNLKRQQKIQETRYEKEKISDQKVIRIKKQKLNKKDNEKQNTKVKT